MSGTQSTPTPSPMTNPTPAPATYSHHFSQPGPSPSPSVLGQQDSYSSHALAPQTPMPQTPAYQPQHNYNHYAGAATAPVPQHTNPLPNYEQYRGSSTVARPSAPISTHSSQANAYNPPRPIEVYTLQGTPMHNLYVPEDIKSQFHRDEQGRILFFTTPPLDANPVPERLRDLGHSLRYLADKARHKEENAKKRKARELNLESEAAAKLQQSKAERELKKQQVIDQVAHAIGEWCNNMSDATDLIYKDLYGDNWKEARELEQLKLAQKQEEASSVQARLAEFRRQQEDKNRVDITGFRWI